MTWAYVYW